MKKDQNQIDVDDYFEMTVKNRSILDIWLRSLGCNPARTKRVMLDREAHKVTTVEYLLDESSGKDYTKYTIIGEIEHIYSYEEEPPIWAG